jgi:hypothetical protein
MDWLALLVGELPRSAQLSAVLDDPQRSCPITHSPSRRANSFVMPPNTFVSGWTRPLSLASPTAYLRLFPRFLPFSLVFRHGSSAGGTAAVTVARKAPPSKRDARERRVRTGC